MSKTLFDKIWDRHMVKSIEGDHIVLYIDREYVHEVTSPQAFAGLRKRGIKVRKPGQVTALPDHNVPTVNQHLPIEEPLSKKQVETLEANCKDNKVPYYGLGNKWHGIVHVSGPELGLTQPGMTIVCGDSHTSTHGAFGAIAFGVGTSEVEMVMASQCLLQSKPKQMRITVNGHLKEGVGAKDLALYIISKLSTSGGTGYFVEFAGEAFRNLSMEGRMTVCNMSIEMGARGGLIAPDQTTFDYVKGREFAPKGADYDKVVEDWKTLFTDKDAKFDCQYEFKAQDIPMMITYGTNPGMGIPVSGVIPTKDTVAESDKASLEKSLAYMGFASGEPIKGKKVDYVFIGSCTNGRIEDFREAAEVFKGHKVADGVTVWLVPGSKMVEQQAIAEGLDKAFAASGITFRQPGCSACLAMNEDKIPAGKYSVSTSNRNFEGRQGPGSRTMLASPRVAAMCAIKGFVTDSL